MSAESDRLWTVARFPNGSWTTGGSPTSPDYELCETWQIWAPSREAAKKKAQAMRARSRAKEKRTRQ